MPLQAGLAERCPRGGRRGVDTLPPPARRAAQHPSPVRLRLPPPPARAAGWARRRTGTWEVCGNFSSPGAARAGAGARKLEPGVGEPRRAAVPVLAGCKGDGSWHRRLQGTWVWRWWAGGRERCCPPCRDGDITEQPWGLPPAGPDPSVAVSSVRPAAEAPGGGGTWVWAATGRGTMQAGGGSRSDTRGRRGHSRSRTLGRLQNTEGGRRALAGSALAGNFDLWALPR